MNKAITISIVAVVSIVLLGSVLMPVINDATKPVEKEVYEDVTGTVPGSYGTPLTYINPSNFANYLSVSARAYDGYDSTIFISAQNGDDELIYTDSPNIHGLIYADNYVKIYISFINGVPYFYMDGLSIFTDLYPNGCNLFSAQFNLMVTIPDTSSDSCIYSLNVDIPSESDNTYEESGPALNTYSFLYIASETGSYSTFGQSSTVVEYPVKTTPSVQAGDMHIELTEGLYKIKSTELVDPKGTAIYLAIPALVIVALVAMVAAVALRDRY